MKTKMSFDPESPNGYHIVSSETGNVLLIWKILSIGVLCLIGGLMLIQGASTSKYFVIVGLTLLVLLNTVLVFAKIVLGKRIRRYHEMCMQIRAGINLCADTAFAEADKSILLKKDLEQARKLRFFKSLVEMNKAFPECKERPTCKCKKGEGLLYSKTCVDFYEQRTERGAKCWERAGEGQLQVTSRRIVFVDKSQNREFRLKDLVAVEAAKDTITLLISNRVKPIHFESLDGLLVATIVKMCRSNPEWKVVPRASMIEPSVVSLDCDVNSETLCAMSQSATAFVAAVERMAGSQRIDCALQGCSALNGVNDCAWFSFKNCKMGFVAVADLFVSFLKLGHSVEDLSSPEGLGLLIALSKLFNLDRAVGLSEWTEKSFRQGVDALLEPYIAKINEVLPFYRQDNALYAADIVSAYEYSLVSGYVSALYKWAIQIVGADDEVSTSEKRWLGVLKGYSTLKGRIGDKTTMISLQEINSIKCD